MNLEQVCCDLIQIPSISGHITEINRITDYVRHLMTPLGAMVDVIRPADISPVIYIRNRDTPCPDVAIVGHLDVVPGDVSQFSPRVQDGRLYGRGALDMKSMAAVAFSSMQFVLENNLPLSFAIVLETDEEVGSRGMQHFIQTHPDFIPRVVLDIDVGGDITRIIDACKGAVFATLTATGRAAHGSTPWDGLDANERMFQTLNRLRARYPYYAADHTVLTDTWVNTMHVGTIAGGKTANIVCDSCMATVDMRLVPGYTLPQVERDLNNALGPGVSYDITMHANAVEIKHDDPLLQAYHQVAEHVLGTSVGFQHIGGITTSRLLFHRGSTVIYHAATGAGMHGADEWIDLTTLHQLATIQQAFLHRYVHLFLKK